ncbi:calcium-binding protein [Nitrosomonas sp. Nm58]|uniref:calcium-binding protein n=1 Tax=Nitrosomonas sp. Nm58 TaxID=200126 RepID=UPI00089CD485|nr:calcium-binding protein [Nitrosomonas sp. Nm58]SDY05939.1 hypothetical protein SAMN05421754_1001221 [Nitrosomonas sp. Nm58]
MAISDIQKQYIVGLTVGLFNGAPGANFLREFSNLIEGGMSFEELADFLVATPQFQQDILKGNVTVAHQTEVLLKNFGLTPGNTDPASADAQAEKFITDSFNAGRDIGDIVIEAGLYLLGNPAPEFADTANLFKNKILVAEIYSRENSDDNVTDLQAILAGVTAAGPATDADAVAYLESIGIGGNPGETFAFTVNQDNLIGTVGNDTFIAAAAQDGTGNLINTLQSVDTVDGGAGIDTLKFTDVDGSTVTPVMSNVEIVEARFTSSGAIDLSNADGVTEVRVLGSTSYGEVSGVGTAGKFVIGNDKAGNEVDFYGGTATALDITFNGYGNTNPDDETQGAVWFNDNAVESATVNLNNSNVELHFHNEENLKSMSVNATGTNIFDTVDEGDEFIETLTVTGAGSVDFDDNDWEALKTLTADTATGNLTNIHVGAAAVSVTLGSGNDEITYDAAPAATAVVNLGAGDDKLVLTAAPAAGVTLTGGDGKDTISLTSAIAADIGLLSEEELAKITGFEVLSISDALTGGDPYDVSNLAGVTDFVAEDGVVTGETATVKVASNSTVTLAGNLGTNNGALVVDVKDAATTDATANVVLNSSGSGSIGVDLTANDVETLNLTASSTATNGSSYNVTLTDDALVALNIGGDQIVNFASDADMAKLATINASGNTAGVNIDVSAATATAAAITVTGSAGDDTILGSGNADTISGGAGNDTITGGAKADTLAGGEGNDIFAYTALADSTLVNLDVISDFKANTFGNGTNGAVNETGAAADATKWTGDVIDLSVVNTGGFDKIDVSVQANSSDAQTFLQNLGQATTDTIGAALDSSTGRVLIDVDSNGTADMVIQLTGVTTIDEAAFIINIPV